MAGKVPMRRMLLGLIVLASAGLASWMIVLDRQNRLLWDHWDVVKPGILYRSGQLTGLQLTRAVADFGIRTVVNLQLPDRELEEERVLARKLGVGFVNLPMPGDGFGEEFQFRKVLEVIDDPALSRAGSLCPGDLPHRLDGGPVPVRARWLDDRGRRGGAEASDLSGRLDPRLHLRHGQDEAVDRIPPARDDRRAQRDRGRRRQGDARCSLS